jgi:hypothetical protein
MKQIALCFVLIGTPFAVYPDALRPIGGTLAAPWLFGSLFLRFDLSPRWAI